MTELDTDIWLVALREEPSPEAIRAYWNVTDNDVLDAEHQERVWVGRTDAWLHPLPGGAGRVFSLMFLVGTTPEYVAPRIDDGLIRRLTDALESDDRTVYSRVEGQVLAHFLEARHGWFLVCDEVST